MHDNDVISNFKFFNYLIEKGLVKKNDLVVEYCNNFSNSITIREPFFSVGYKYIFTDKAPLSIDFIEQMIKVSHKTHRQLNFITPTFNDCVREYMDYFDESLIFNIGIATKSFEEYSEMKFKLNRYKKELVASGIQVREIEDNLVDNGNRIYLLTNRGIGNGK